MTPRIQGIHHVTAITGEPQANLDFTLQALGMRLAKRTVNFDDPTAYHFYFAGSKNLSPLWTTFPYPDGAAGKPGFGQATRTGLWVAKGSLEGWAQRLAEHGATFLPDRVPNSLAFQAPDGLAFELIESDTVTDPFLAEPFAGVELATANLRASVSFLEKQFGVPVETTEEGALATLPDGTFLRLIENRERGRVAIGSVHHVAFRVADEHAQLALRQVLVEAGLDVTTVQERCYFKSIYFREPGGVLFEIATDGPGVLIDEEEAELGQNLMLPPWFEPHRENIEPRLRPISVPAPFAHWFETGVGAPVLVLHGTGGDEHSLVPIARSVAPDAPMLSVRGRVMEGRMPRFFKRFAEGVFDYDDIKLRADELAGFLKHAAKRYGFRQDKLVAYGYSNGANIAWSTLLTHPDSMAGAILHRPTVTLRPDVLPDLSGKRIFVAAGERDPYAPAPAVEELVGQMRDAGADVELLWLPVGHELTREEIEAAGRWFAGATTARK